MHITVYIPLLIAALAPAVVARAARRLPPRPAAWALLCTAAVATAGWLGSLALLAFATLVQIPGIAREGHWSPQLLRAADPVFGPVGVLGALALAASAAALGTAALRQAAAHRLARREVRRLPSGGELAVLDDDTPDAFALPGAPGRIVVTRGMLRSLDHVERQALLAHERAHLAHRHHRFLAAWRLAAAVNPLLRPLADTGAFMLERWADEDAATAVGDRTVVARALARAALATAGSGARPARLAAASGAVPQRVRALVAPPPAHRPLPLLAGGLVLAVSCASLTSAASDSDRMLDTARMPACSHVEAPGNQDDHRIGGRHHDDRDEHPQRDSRRACGGEGPDSPEHQLPAWEPAADRGSPVPRPVH
ncbi:Zn-dependent protease with chaperone function [Kitasatospora sp. MAA19]|uniref:M56 family metallopeptidase n=1 Tax=unclassified Kitasatospora TaxID=2633591 RepID=UPI0024741F00|nr:M56 family metallopeptidase [Kitasatospora sp. MAA19]MDH6711352.1 Zn-dependent protease with chaperone function [Kitasatospora sp. MAA19]